MIQICTVNRIPTKVNGEIKSVPRDMFKLKEIDQKIMNYLTVKKAQLGRFYLLPKIINGQ